MGEKLTKEETDLLMGVFGKALCQMMDFENYHENKVVVMQLFDKIYRLIGDMGD